MNMPKETTVKTNLDSIIDILYEEACWDKKIISHDFIKDGIDLVMKDLHPNLTYEISILLTNDKEIQKLNNQWRGKDKATNVLSFPQLSDLEEIPKNAFPLHLGDIVFSYETILDEAKAQDKQFKNHFLHLLIHGILHLLGYDHTTPDDAKIMETLEVSYLSRFGLSSPYE